MAARGDNHGIGYGVAKLLVKRAMNQILFGLFLSVVANGALACPAGYTCVPFDAGGAKTWGNTDSGFSWPTNLAACVAIFTPLPPNAVEISVGGDVSGHNSFGQCLIRYSYDQNFYLTFVYVYAVGSCPAGYKNNGTDCQKPIVACPAHASGTPCVCDVGYKFDAAGTSCVPDQYTLTLTPDKATIEPGKSYTFTATVTNQDGSPPSQPVPVAVKVEVDPTSGGHDHGEIYAKRDKGNGAPTTGFNSFPITFTSTEVSGTHKITATCDKCSNGPKIATVDVKVDGLIPILGSVYYALTEDGSAKVIGDNGNHSGNHYLTSSASMKLWRVARDFYEYQIQKGVAIPTLLHLNDASLKWGGKFDVAGKWTGYHYKHDRGDAIDVRANTAAGHIPEAYFTDFENMAAAMGADAQLHCSATSDPSIDNCAGDENRHYHVILK